MVKSASCALSSGSINREKYPLWFTYRTICGLGNRPASPSAGRGAGIGKFPGSVSAARMVCKSRSKVKVKVSSARPQDRILGIGTKIVIRTTTVDGVTFEYYRALHMYSDLLFPVPVSRPPTAGAVRDFERATGGKRHGSDGIFLVPGFWRSTSSISPVTASPRWEMTWAELPTRNQYWMDLALDRRRLPTNVGLDNRLLFDTRSCRTRLPYCHERISCCRLKYPGNLAPI